MYLPYMFAMLLGRTFNYNVMQVGIDIFPPGEVEAKKEVIESYFTDSLFKMIKSKRDVQDILDVNGELSLQVMSGKFNLDGSGSYLKSNKEGEYVVEILCRQTYETVTHTIRSEAVPEAGWQNHNADLLGTHYVRSITYGGELIASVKYRATNKADMEKIEASLSAGLGLEGTLDLSVGAKFKQVQSELTEGSSLTIDYYATTPVENIPRTVDGLQTLITDFQKRVKEVNNGIGIPIRMELMDLTALSTGSQIVAFTKNAAVTALLDEIITKFDDVRGSRKAITAWLEGMDLNDVESQRVSELYSRLEDVNRVFITVIAAMSVAENSNPHQFDAALNAYKGTENTDLPGKYYRLFLTLKAFIEASRAAGCLSPEMRNKYVLASNIRDSISSKREVNATDVGLCKTACRQDVYCKSLTYVAPIGATPPADTSCFINLVAATSANLLEVPANGAEGHEVFFYERDPRYCARK